MANTVNLDALIPREDFEVRSEGEALPSKTSITIFELQRDNFFFRALRKPDFQRETYEWTPKRVAGLIKSFVDDELIPAVILWANEQGLNFVVDGSHRLSALIAWVQDDYGDGKVSREFFENSIEDAQLEIAKRTKHLIEKEFGKYEDHVKAIESPELYGPDIVKRARKFARLGLDLQWVKGDVGKAEDSFKRINQQAAMITPLELELINSRKKPNAIAARAVIRRGTGHKYWQKFGPPTQDRIEALATELHNLIFAPKQAYPLKSADLAAGGPIMSATALSMVYNFINLAVGIQTPPEDDKDGNTTCDYLNRCEKVMKLLVSNDESSLGLHPAVYFYSWTGKQQPILFQVIAQLIIDWERAKKLPKFIEVRGRLEDFLVANRALINQLVRKYGTKSSGYEHLRTFYDDVLELLGQNKSSEEIVIMLMQKHKYLQPAEELYEGIQPRRLSTQVKSGVALKQFLLSAPRCPICQGYVPSQAISVDHDKREEDMGTHEVANLRVTHPYCNTGYKEREHSRKRK
jgi:hypothetical protein